MERILRTLPGIVLIAAAILGQARAASASGTAPLIWPLVIGHRGLGQKSAPIPENSIPALVEAFRRGASAVEFDVQLSSDGEVVLAHDVRLERLTDGFGCVAETSFKDLRKLHLKDGVEAIHADLTVPTFAEALEAIRGFDESWRPFLADIHIKVYDGFHGDWGGLRNGHCASTKWAELTDRVLQTVDSLGLADRVIYTSFDPRVLARIHSTEPQASTGLLAFLRPKHRVDQAEEAHDRYVALFHGWLDADEINDAHRDGMQVLAWTPKKAKDLREEMGEDHVDGVITDSLDTALKARRAIERRK